MSNGSDEKLTLSDWITFLSSEKNPSLANILSAGAVALSAYAVIVSIAHPTGKDSVVIVVPILVIYLILAAGFQWRANKAGKLLKKIMSGVLTDVSQIRTEWDC